MHSLSKKYLLHVPLLVLCLWILPSCGADTTDTGEHYGDLLDSPDNLVLTEDEHVYGWGRDDCFFCHNINNIHLVNNTDIEIDVEAIQETTKEDGEASCSTCHGDNGL